MCLMTKIDHIPSPVVRRLSLYLRELEWFQSNDRKTVSSKDLGRSLGLSDAQVRKDLAWFGHFGQPGVGYSVEELAERMRRILGTDKKLNVMLVGAGNLGRALLSYRGFSNRGFDVVAVFDKDPAKIGTIVDGVKPLKVQDPKEMREMAVKRAIRLGILAVPASAAQAVFEEMVSAGIRGLLNFAPVVLQADARVAVVSVDLAVQLEQLSFQTSGTAG